MLVPGVPGSTTQAIKGWLPSPQDTLGNQGSPRCVLTPMIMNRLGLAQTCILYPMMNRLGLARTCILPYDHESLMTRPNVYSTL